MLGVLDSPPGWVWTDADYASVCAQFADRYRAVGIEVAIEPSNAPYVPGPSRPPDGSARICKAAGQAVKNAAPNMKRIANVDTRDYKTGAQDPNRCFDGMIAAVPEPAPLPRAPGRCTPTTASTIPPRPRTRTGSGGGPTASPTSRHSPPARTRPFRSGSPSTGWSTCSNRSECVAERRRAAYVAAGARLAIDESKVGRVCVYIGDRDGGDDEEGRFGMYRQADGAPKPVLAALSSLS